MNNPDAAWRDGHWRDGHDGTASPEQLAAGRRVLRARATPDRWARHDQDAADAQDEATQTRKGGNR